MAPKARPASQEFIYEFPKEEGTLFVSTIKADGQYVSYCSGHKLTEFIHAYLAAQLPTITSDKKFKFNVNLVGGGGLYQSGLRLVDNHGALQTTMQPDLSSFTHRRNHFLKYLQATTGLTSDIRWLNDNSTFIIDAIQKLLKSKGVTNCNIHLRGPHIEKSTKSAEDDESSLPKAVTKDYFEVVHGNHNKKDDDSRSSITIDFTSWRDFCNKNEDAYIAKFAEVIAHYRKGKKALAQLTQGYDAKSILDSSIHPELPSTVWTDFKKYQLDLLGIINDPSSDFTADDILFICLENNIDHAKFLKALEGQEKEIEEKSTDNNDAVNTFIRANLLGFENFHKGVNGELAKKANATDDNIKEIKKTFFSHVSFVMQEEPGLHLASYPHTNEQAKPVYYPKDEADSFLSGLSKLGDAAHRQQIYFGTKLIPTPVSKTIESFIQPERSSSNGSKNSIEDMNIEDVSGTTPPPSNDKMLLSDVAGEFIGAVCAALVQICTPQGKYNVPLALDFLENFMSWYMQFLFKISGTKTTDYATYQKYDEKFLSNIIFLLDKIIPQLGKENSKEKQWLLLLQVMINSYKNQKDKTADAHIEKTYTIRASALAWYDLLAENTYKSVKLEPLTSAKKPTDEQSIKYNSHVSTARMKFSYLSKHPDSTPLDSLKELYRSAENSTTCFTENIMPDLIPATTNKM